MKMLCVEYSQYQSHTYNIARFYIGLITMPTTGEQTPKWGNYSQILPVRNSNYSVGFL